MGGQGIDDQLGIPDAGEWDRVIVLAVNATAFTCANKLTSVIIKITAGKFLRYKRG